MLRKIKNPKKRIRISLLLLYDVMAILLSEYMALLIRYEFRPDKINVDHLETMLKFSAVNVIVTLAIFAFFSLYESLWRYASVTELLNLTLACMVSAGMQLIGTFMLEYRMPRSYYVLYFLVLLPLMMAGRFSYRLLRIVKQRLHNIAENEKPVVTMVIGAGDAGLAIIKEIQSSYHLNWKVACVIDDSKVKEGNKILGVPIIGGRECIIKAAEKYHVDEIIFAIPTLSRDERTKILNICKETGCKLRTLPGIYQLINEEVSISKLREVNIDDLLGREPIQTDLDDILGYVKNQVVLVTGGGGSIGSELCRQIASHEPKQLIIFEIYENSAYDIQQELKIQYPKLNLTVLIGSVRNTHRVQQIFRDYHPDLVYHAAAHKHVPLMEESPNEAIKNNVFGTLNTARAAQQYGTKKFILISTDKAVNPTNIMGASKRICEMIIQGLAQDSRTEFVAVRFGNVLGSNGSVIPLFERQILVGGPVTVTDKNIIRYFMTIPEAVSLVLQAGAYAKGGEIFVLDMGEPVKIDDLARNLIKLSGYRPDEDIKIVYTGLRPGEKLYEELLMKEEGLTSTRHKRIFIGKPIVFVHEEFWEQLAELKKEAYEDGNYIREYVAKIVETYHYQQ
ncbi:MAG: nucleoside-diphosphate sugar epimerase/dehydratase [Ruminococcus sp.]|nr:nucleoside-diphosphate sugar epimerase/dehydratase [Ruminococcus sp.]